MVRDGAVLTSAALLYYRRVRSTMQIDCMRFLSGSDEYYCDRVGGAKGVVCVV